MNKLTMKRNIVNTCYLTFFLMLLLSLPSILTKAQCVTDEIAEQNCQNDPANCALRDFYWQTILGAFDTYQQDPTLYATNLAEVEQRVIPVVFHIIHQCGDEYITDEQCAVSIDEVNLDFQGNNYELNEFYDSDAQSYGLGPFEGDLGSFETLRFELASIDEYGNATTGITRTIDYSTYDGTNSGTYIKSLIQWDPAKYLNVWVVNTTGGSAYAIFPEDANSGSSRVNDGIVISHNYLSLIGTANTLSHRRRHTMTHEIGHWLGLRHTWGPSNSVGQDSNCTADDDICDTPNGIGLNDVVYPKAISFNYTNSVLDGQATFNQNGLSTNGNIPSSEGNGIIGSYIYEGIDQDAAGYPNSCETTQDCFVNGGTGDRPDNIYNFMDYGAEFMFTKDQIKMMVTVLTCDIAERKTIGTAGSNVSTIIPANSNFATLTTDSYIFVENDYNNALNETGITLTLSEGTFTTADFIQSITPDLSSYGLGYSITYLNNNKSANIALTANTANIPSGGLENISITINLNEINQGSKPYYGATNENTITIGGFEIKVKDDNGIIPGVSGPIHHNYVSVIDGELCIDDTSPKPGFNFDSYGVILGSTLVKTISGVYIDETFSNGNPLLDEGFYLTNNSPLNIEVLVKNGTAGKGDIPLLPSNLDLINGYNYSSPTSPYKYSDMTILRTSSFNSDDISGMARLYSENYPDNLNKEGYVGLRFQAGCEQAWYYAWLKVSVEEVNGKPTLCMLEGQFENVPHPANNVGNYLTGQQDCDEIMNSPVTGFTWIESISMNNTPVGNTSTGADGYTDYSNLGSQVTLQAGTNYIMQVNTQNTVPNSKNTFFAFADFNTDGIFDYSELLFYREINQGVGPYSFVEQFNIPGGIANGNYEVRLIFSRQQYNNNLVEYYLNPCSPIIEGEVEDYVITIGTSTNPNPGGFDDYPWLNDLDLTDCCENGIITEYTSATGHPYIFIESASGCHDGKLFNKSGQPYCESYNNQNFDCLSFYALSNPVVLWNCTDTPGNPDPDPDPNPDPVTFDDYPWLNNLDLTDCCENGIITEYTSATGHPYIFIESTSGCHDGKLFNESGQPYCESYNNQNFDCLSFYALSNPVVLWNCTDTPGNPDPDPDPDPNPDPVTFDDYPWLNNLDLTDCCENGIITEYTSATGHPYIFIESTSGCHDGKLFNESGQPYCESYDNQNFDCLSFYALSNPVVLWNCTDTPGNPDPDPSPNPNPDPITFDDYPWLNNLNLTDCCENGIITEYTSTTGHLYIFIESTSGCHDGKLFNASGQPYCESFNNQNFDCVSTYGLTNPVELWNCNGSPTNPNPGPGQNPAPGSFDDYPWLNDLDFNDCCENGLITEYTSAIGYPYIFIESDAGCHDGKLFNASGQPYCESFSNQNFDCVSTYNLSNPVVLWNCNSNKLSLKNGFNFEVFPNPFVNAFQIKYQLPADGKVSIGIYNINGEKVKTIINRKIQQAGNQLQNVYDDELAKGIYFVHLSTTDHHQILKLMKF